MQAAAAAMEVGDDSKMQMDEDDSLQTSNVVFDYGDDEERVAMEKVHGLNDFDTDDQSKFSTLDEVNGFVGDDDWRAMASEAAAAVDESTLAAAAAAAHQDGSSMQLCYDGGDDQGQDEEFVECGSPEGGLQIMRFTRKRTPNQRGRRPPPPPLVKPIIGAALRESLQLEQEKLKTATVTVKTEADTSALPVSRKSELAPVKKPLPQQQQQQQQAVRKVEPAERMLHRPKQPLRVSEEQQQQQNKKPKALAFQKSRNIINKRINADSSVKPEATSVELDCSEVRETQGKNRAAAAELRALGEEIRPLLLAGEEGGEELNKQQQLPPAVHEKWLDLHCKQLRTRFDLHFSLARHFLCHSSAEHCCSSSS